ncbi:helix-turn-helix domain-containing protein [Umezawaea beigongshangensis]|uniref:helix-turn-helix domain-containing protein n=1 Tax=Umezawaea beigongshangensis TaxID=2780383 RepID=UPI0018F214C8|nr:LysR family transcriptional regulator [Umezawaea beigongshangensis]
MELRRPECSVAVVEESGFTRAAARSHVVQSAVSATIASLERELRAPSLVRTGRQITLTDAGRQLLPEARAALDAARAAALPETPCTRSSVASATRCASAPRVRRE